VLPNAIALDALNFLRFQEDPEREPLLPRMYCAPIASDRRPGCCSGHISSATSLIVMPCRLQGHIGPALRSPHRTDTTLALPAPYVIVADITSAHELQRLLQIGFPRPLPITEAQRALHATTHVVPVLSNDPEAFVTLHGAAWLDRSSEPPRVSRVGRSLALTLRSMEKGDRVLLEDDWRERARDESAGTRKRGACSDSSRDSSSADERRMPADRPAHCRSNIS